MQKRIIRDFLLVLLAILLLWHCSPAKEQLYQLVYDLTTRQKIITTRQEIDTILDQFEQIPVTDLPEEYLQWTLLNQPPYQQIVKDAQFYKISGKQIFQFLVGDFRIKDFLPRDDIYRYYIRTLKNDAPIYLLIDRRLLYKLLALQKALFELGYDETGFDIVNGFRHPRYNIQVGGASKSRHILGEALDLRINDINQDGRRTQRDKAIVLDLLEKRIIKDQGGIGLYPGTMSVHFDVRGYKARWNTH